MAYEIVWNSKADEDFSALDNETRRRVVAKIDSIADNPGRYLVYLPKYRVHKLRAGDWRIFVDVWENDRRLEILRIRHRSKAYQRI